MEEHARLIGLLVSAALGIVSLVFLNSLVGLVFLYIAGYIVVVSIVQPENIFALQEDTRQQEKAAKTRQFIQCLASAGIRQDNSENGYTVECLSLSPLVFIFSSSAMGATLENVGGVCSQSLPVFNAIRYTIERAANDDQNITAYRIGFYEQEPAEILASMEVKYSDISAEQPRIDYIPVGLFEDGSTAYVSFKNRSALLGGLPRMGKTNLMNIALLGLARLGTSERILILSPKILDYQAFRPVAELYETPLEIYEALRAINDEIERRKKYCILHNIKSITSATSELPHIVIFIDEFAVIKGSKILEDGGKKWRKIGDEIEAEITKIVAQGGFANCQVLATSQRLSSQVMSTDLRELIAGNIISYANAKQTSTEFLFGELATDAPAENIPITAKGVGYIYVEGEMPKPRLFKTAYNTPEQEEEIIEHILTER